MGVNNRDFVSDGNGAFPTATYLPLTAHYGVQVPASQTDLEIMSFRLPSDSDWQLVSAHGWLKTLSGSNAHTINIQDDGVDVCSDTTLVAGSQVEIAHTAPKRFKGGSEVQVTATTGATTTMDGICVTLVFRPYPLAEGGQAVT